MRQTSKQFTSIYKDGIEFSDVPISTGGNAVFLPKQIDKWTPMIATYEEKIANQKLMKQSNVRPMEKYPGSENQAQNKDRHTDSKSSSSYSSEFINPKNRSELKIAQVIFVQFELSEIQAAQLLADRPIQVRREILWFYQRSR
jgi:hypothetical protein